MNIVELESKVSFALYQGIDYVIFNYVELCWLNANKDILLDWVDTFLRSINSSPIKSPEEAMIRIMAITEVTENAKDIGKLAHSLLN